MTGLDENLESISALPSEPTTCQYCHSIEDEECLYLHEASGCRLCQECLGKFLEQDIKDSPDHEGHFMNWTFRTGWTPFKFDAFNDENTAIGSTIADCLEQVLMKLKLI